VTYFTNDIYTNAPKETIDVSTDNLEIAIMAYQANTVCILDQQLKSVRVNENELQHRLGSYQ